MYSMEQTKLTVRISRDTLEEAKRFAREHGTTLTRLVVTHLEQLPVSADPGAMPAGAPITRRLAGTLAPEASIEEYRTYLERKHG
jgi:hypothetical protein